jgi:HAD superfamily hydrolase (TIGR01549 family)
MSALVIFDLDNTLVDSIGLKPLRDRREWAEVYRMIADIRPFMGMSHLWMQLRKMGCKLAVVTHSPRSYAEKVLCHVDMTPDCLIAYHDLKGHLKPSPEGYRRVCDAFDAMRICVAVGDEVADLKAADAFSCRGAFAGWCRNPLLTKEQCMEAGWRYLEKPSDLFSLI